MYVLSYLRSLCRSESSGARGCRSARGGRNQREAAKCFLTSASSLVSQPDIMLDLLSKLQLAPYDPVTLLVSIGAFPSAYPAQMFLASILGLTLHYIAVVQLCGFNRCPSAYLRKTEAQKQRLQQCESPAPDAPPKRALASARSFELRT